MKKILPILIVFLFLGLSFSPHINAVNIHKNNDSLYPTILEKTDDTPDVEWMKTYGGPNRDLPKEVLETDASGYIIAGGYNVNPSIYTNEVSKGWIIEVDYYGDVIWETKRTIKDTGYDSIYNNIKKTDGGYYIGGNMWNENQSEGCLSKIDFSGKILWEKNYTTGTCKDIAITEDGIIIIGTTFDGGDLINPHLIKTDFYGNVEWTKTIDPNPNSTRDDISLSHVIDTNDGGFICSGYIKHGTLNYDCWILKMNKYGDIEWERSYDSGSIFDFCDCIEKTSDGGFILGGNYYYEKNDNGREGGLIIKIDSYGNKIWEKKYKGYNNDGRIHNIRETNDGGYISIGRTGGHDSWDVWVLKIDKDGNKLWSLRFDGDKHNTDEGNYIIQTSDGGYLIAGETLISEDSETGYDYDIWLIKLSPEDKKAFKPNKPSGPTNGEPGVKYSYTTSATHPSGKDICYGWDWDGDYIVDEWTEYHPSGETITTNHSWDEEGYYSVRVKARDDMGKESEWSDPLSVTMPRDKLSHNSLLVRLFKLFPFPANFILKDLRVYKFPAEISKKA